jgi:1,4-dihydroxy-6-naphthoate synthase
MEYVARYAAEMDKDVMRKHIDLYVNEYTRSLKEEGREAILRLLEEARKKMLTDPLPDRIFAD